MNKIDFYFFLAIAFGIVCVTSFVIWFGDELATTISLLSFVMAEIFYHESEFSKNEKKEDEQ